MSGTRALTVFFLPASWDMTGVVSSGEKSVVYEHELTLINGVRVTVSTAIMHTAACDVYITSGHPALSQNHYGTKQW